MVLSIDCGRSGDGECRNAGNSKVLHANPPLKGWLKMSAPLPAINLQFGQDAFFHQDVTMPASLRTSIVIADNPDPTEPRRHFR
jgi:hypothetical protein